MTRPSIASWWVAAALLPGCAGIGTAEIPDQGIAIYWYDVETDRKRAEAIEEMLGGRRSRQGVANLADVGRYVGGLIKGDPSVNGPGASLESRFPGRLAFLDPRTEAVTPLEVALRGALPVDRSPDGKRLMFSQLVGRYRQLFEYDLGTAEVRRLTHGPGVHSDGCYGPEGRYVFARAEVLKDRVVTTITMTDPGGVNPRKIGEGEGDYGPACAPDGRAIAWVKAVPRGRDTLYTLMPAVGGTLRALGPGRYPSFSPDGKWIVYTVPSRERSYLARIRPDGTGRKAVGESTLDSLQPSFSPDGNLVVYVADDGFHRRFYLRRFDGTGDRVLLRSGGGEYPVW